LPTGDCTGSPAQLCRHLHCLLSQLAQFSRTGRPAGSQPACTCGPVALRLNRYPLHYKMAFAFSSVPYLPPRRLALRLPTLAGGRQAYHVPGTDLNGLGSACSPVARVSVRGDERTPLPGHLPFGSSPCVLRRGSPLGLSVFTTFSSGSPGLTLPFNSSSQLP
jgi:hypothetical protein